MKPSRTLQPIPAAAAFFALFGSLPLAVRSQGGGTYGAPRIK